MGFRCGIVGLPNVGKSTLFNALSGASAAEAANYPFCTIEPNVGRVPVPDSRIDRLAELSGSADRTPAMIDFVDIAGLVKGASRGEGLGNRFLASIRGGRCNRPRPALLRRRSHHARSRDRRTRRETPRSWRPNSC